MPSVTPFTDTVTVKGTPTTGLFVLADVVAVTGPERPVGDGMSGTVGVRAAEGSCPHAVAAPASSAPVRTSAPPATRKTRIRLRIVDTVDGKDGEWCLERGRSGRRYTVVGSR